MRLRDKGQTAKQVGELIGVDRATIYRWESGEVDPPLSKWIRYVRACGHDPAKIISKIDIGCLDPSHMCD